MKKTGLLCLLFILSYSLKAQHSLETLDRGLVAVKTSSGVFTSWRIPGEEWHRTTYNLYRDGVKLNSQPLNVSNFTDPEGNLNSLYTIKAVVNGVEQAASSPVQPWGQAYKEITLDVPPSGVTPADEAYAYAANDMSTGHLNDDHIPDLVVKWEALGRDNSHAGYTSNVILDGYTLEGEKLWRIDLGKNIRAGAHYTQFMVYDLDGDGIAEIACKTAPGTKDGLGNFIGKGPAATADHQADYRNSGGYVLSGPEYLTVFDGRTGAELSTINYYPPRGDVNAWGDGYGNRVDRFLACVAYLDGERPSLVMCRGYYTRAVLAAYDFNGTTLSQRWIFDTNNTGNGAYASQGNHNLSVADVDGDGCDEIIYGSCTIDNTGKGLYSTGLGHGDAMHVHDFDPYRKGLEVFKCLEGGDGGTVMFDAATGDILIRHKTFNDCGRCMAGNIMDGPTLGAEVWGGGKVFAATSGTDITNTNLAVSVNFRVYWDGDILTELMDGTWVSKTHVGSPIFQAPGAEANNGTKSNPGLSADLLGDWREELIFRTANPAKIRLYTTTTPTNHRNYTLLHDRQYRLGLVWQNVAYNQPPHLSYFLGNLEGITVPPPPVLNNNRHVYKGTGNWDKASTEWTLNGKDTTYQDGAHAYLTGSAGTNQTLTLTEAVQPDVLTVATPGQYSLVGTTGKLTGSMLLVKQGSGQLTLTGRHDYTGQTALWDGRLTLNGQFPNTPVWTNLNTTLAATGFLGKSLTLRYGTQLYIGGEATMDTLTLGDSLVMESHAELVFDLPGSAAITDSTFTRGDKLTLAGTLSVNDGAIIRIFPHLQPGQTLQPGTYPLIVGDTIQPINLEQVKLEGIPDIPASLTLEGGQLNLVVRESRNPATIHWSGSTSDVWDLVKTHNFVNHDKADYFVTGDTVLVTDSASTRILNLTETLLPTSVTFDNNLDFILTGTGALAGSMSLTKNGTGKLAIRNINQFTGKVQVNDGTLELTYLPNSLDGNGTLGPASSNPALFEINGATLNLNRNSTSERALTIGPKGATIQVNGTTSWNASIIGGSLTKTGYQELSFGAANTNSELIIKNGTVRLTTDQAQPGRKVIFEGGTLRAYDSGGSYSLASYPLVVDSGKVGHLYVDGRCSYTGSLTGSGTFYVYIPWIRSDFDGNWSNFSGTIVLVNPSPFRNYSGYGYPKAIIDLSTEGVFDDMKTQTVKLGAIKGKGRLWGAGTWEIGTRNEDFTFQGNIESGIINKVGTGVMTLMSAMTSSANFYVSQGGLLIYGASSTPGTSNVYVRNGAYLCGHGKVQGNLTVENGGTLYAGYYNPSKLSAGSSLVTWNVTLQPSARFVVKVDPGTSKTDRLLSNGTFAANGTLEMLNIGSQPFQEGQAFQIIKPTTITGAFTSIKPAIPGEGLIWDLSDLTTTGTIKVVNPLSLEAVSSTETLAYPNPTHGRLTVLRPSNWTTCNIKLSNLSGQLILEKAMDSLEAIELDLSSQQKGLYLLTLKNGKESRVQKISVE